MPGKKLTPKDLEHFESQLRIMLGVLNGDIDRLEASTLGGEDKPTVKGEEGEGYSIEFSLELLQQDSKTMKEVVDALGRIQDGSFGECEGCGCWILKERLRAMPHARYCIACQREAENDHS